MPRQRRRLLRRAGLSRPARTVAAPGNGLPPHQARPARDRRDGRRGRLRHRAGSLRPHVPAQRRHDRHRPQQPDLRSHHRAGVTDDRPSDADRLHAPRRARGARESHRPGARRGRHVRRARLRRRRAAPHAALHRRPVAQGALGGGCLPAVRDLEQAQHVLVVQRARLLPRQAGLGYLRPLGGVRPVAQHLPRAHLLARTRAASPSACTTRSRAGPPTRRRRQPASSRAGPMRSSRATYPRS